MTDAQAIWEAADEVRRTYARLASSASGIEQTIYVDLHDSWGRFQSELERRVPIEKTEPKQL